MRFDGSRWDLWWLLNREPYLDLRAHLEVEYTTSGGDGPTASDPFDRGDQALRALPLLCRALEDGNPGVVASALLGLARLDLPNVGEDGHLEERDRFELILPHLADANASVSESACMALGILGDPRGIFPLAEILEGGPAGAERLGGDDVPARLAAFSAYSLGLIGAGPVNPDVRRYVVGRLARRLEDSRDAVDGVEVACVLSLGLVPLEVAEPGSSAAKASWAAASRQAQVRWLLGRLDDRDLRPTVRGHLPISAARLVLDLRDPRTADLEQQIVEQLLEHLARASREPRELVAGCVQGLGLLCDGDDDALDRGMREALMKIGARTGDQEVRSLALIALARASARPGDSELGEDAREEVAAHLYRKLHAGNGITRSWASLALGVLARELGDRREPLPAGLLENLRAYLAEARDPSEVGAACIALGLARDRAAEPLLLERLRGQSDDFSRGHAAMALGMIGSRSAVEGLRAAMADAAHRPLLLAEASMALGLLGDFDAVPAMLDMLRDAKSSFTRASIAKSLGRIGDRRTLEPLAAMLGTDTGAPQARSFAAVAVGLVGDSDPLPWNTAVGLDLNVTALTATLYDAEGTGLLNME